MSGNVAYLPVPTMRRERNSRPPKMNGSAAVAGTGSISLLPVVDMSSCLCSSRTGVKEVNVVEQPRLPQTHGRRQRHAGPDLVGAGHRLGVDRFDVVHGEPRRLELPQDVHFEGPQVAFAVLRS